MANEDLNLKVVETDNGMNAVDQHNSYFESHNNIGTQKYLTAPGGAQGIIDAIKAHMAKENEDNGRQAWTFQNPRINEVEGPDFGVKRTFIGQYNYADTGAIVEMPNGEVQIFGSRLINSLHSSNFFPAAIQEQLLAPTLEAYAIEKQLERGEKTLSQTLDFKVVEAGEEPYVTLENGSDIDFEKLVQGQRGFLHRHDTFPQFWAYETTTDEQGKKTLSIGNSRGEADVGTITTYPDGRVEMRGRALINELTQKFDRAQHTGFFNEAVTAKLTAAPETFVAQEAPAAVIPEKAAPAQETSAPKELNFEVVQEMSKVPYIDLKAPLGVNLLERIQKHRAASETPDNWLYGPDSASRASIECGAEALGEVYPLPDGTKRISGLKVIESLIESGFFNEEVAAKFEHMMYPSHALKFEVVQGAAKTPYIRLENAPDANVLGLIQRHYQGDFGPLNNWEYKDVNSERTNVECDGEVIGKVSQFSNGTTTIYDRKLIEELKQSSFFSKEVADKFDAMMLAANQEKAAPAQGAPMFHALNFKVEGWPASQPTRPRLTLEDAGGVNMVELIASHLRRNGNAQDDLQCVPKNSEMTNIERNGEMVGQVFQLPDGRVQIYNANLFNELAQTGFLSQDVIGQFNKLFPDVLEKAAPVQEATAAIAPEKPAAPELEKPAQAQIDDRAERKYYKGPNKNEEIPALEEGTYKGRDLREAIINEVHRIGREEDGNPKVSKLATMHVNKVYNTLMNAANKTNPGSGYEVEMSKEQIQTLAKEAQTEAAKDLDKIDKLNERNGLYARSASPEVTKTLCKNLEQHFILAAGGDEKAKESIEAAADKYISTQAKGRIKMEVGDAVTMVRGDLTLNINDQFFTMPATQKHQTGSHRSV